MLPLDKDLQKPKNSIKEFKEISLRVLNYFPNVISNSEEKGDYLILSSNQAGNLKYVRPINRRLFITEPETFSNSVELLNNVLLKIKNKEDVTDEEKLTIDKVVYTIQQSIGAGLDLLVNPNSARKHVGNRFEELIRVVFTEIGISNSKIVLQIPYETDEGTKTYKCENDLVISPYNEVKSTSQSLDEKEVVVSIKTTSKDRMGKMFIDKLLLERFVKHPQKVIGIFLNDVQRKEENNIGFTLVSGLFMVYTEFLTKLEGVYYLDPPPSALKSPYNVYISTFSELLTGKLNELLAS
ncbi:hypothetical protein ACE1ET_15835 [Saccharicrinis sp. FJH62]|uniref:hypothetical protein n=1 Tax=Saccharicrinis sp. FJH62 TaxID=3344657 RepID=UPI0035D458FC